MGRARADHAVLGSILAFAVGDALGWPIEGRGGRVGGTKDLKPELVLHAWRRREGGRHAPHEEPIPAGQYSDDTQLMLAVARSLRHHNWWAYLTEVELPWWQHYQLGGGGATRRATSSWAKGTPPWRGAQAKRYWEAGGNGAAMRVLPHATSDSFEELRGRVLADGAATHGHPVALVSAQAYAYALWLSYEREGPLGWGQLLDEVLGGVNRWARFEPDRVVPNWADHLPDDYSERWSATVEDLCELLYRARSQVAHGALAMDDQALNELGSFSKQSGAGTVTVAGALYLASRYASDPRQGLLRGAFARGADTDTLAAMTGALLGAVHGPDWLGQAALQVADSRLLHDMAAQIGRVDDLPGEPYSRGAQRYVESELASASPGEHLGLPFYGEVEVVDIHDLDNRTQWIRSWWMHNRDGQTFRISRTSKAQSGPPWRQLRLTASTDHETAKDSSPPAQTQESKPSPARLSPPAAPRSGLVVMVTDIDRSRAFYERVIGMNVSRKTKSALVLNGWLALEVRDGGNAPDSPTDRVAVTVYYDQVALRDAEDRLRAADAKYSILPGERGNSLRTHDPDGVAVELRVR